MSHSFARPDHHEATRGGGIGFALGLAGGIVVAEYLARRALAPTFPVIGSPTVNDMLATALCYVVLVMLAVPADHRSAAALRRAVRGVLAACRTWLPWVGGALMLVAVVVLALLDRALWGSVTLPSFTVPPADTVLAASLAGPLAIVALLLVNGLVIPLAEERLWRGIIQPRLLVAWGALPALAVTAVLFSVKHAIVDASLGRLLALAVGGLVLGIVAYRSGHHEDRQDGWHASAVSHIAANVVATSLALLSTSLS
jgi:membrane protease YdiL (CAAX protease family)